MQINVRTHHVEITDALREYAEKKMSKLDKYCENCQELLIELDILKTADENKRQVAMTTIWIAGAIIRAKETTKELSSNSKFMERLVIDAEDVYENRVGLSGEAYDKPQTVKRNREVKSMVSAYKDLWRHILGYQYDLINSSMVLRKNAIKM